MKRHSIILVLISVLLLVACTDAVEAPTQWDRLERVVRNGVLRAGYFIQPPAVMKDPNSGELRGSFIEAIKFIAEQLGVEVRFVEVDLAQFAGGLQADLYDVSVGPTFRTITRARAVAFTDTIFYLGYDGVVRKDSSLRVETEADLDKEGLVIAVKEGSAVARYLHDNPLKKAETLFLSGTDLTLPLQAVSSGQADVGLMNEHTVEFYARNHGEVRIVLAQHPIQTVGMSWAVKPEDLRWLQFLNTSIEFLVATGKMAAWEREYYFGRSLRRQLVEPEAPTIRPLPG